MYTPKPDEQVVKFRGNNKLSATNANTLAMVKQHLRDNTLKYLETVHNIALGEDINGEKPDIKLQLEAATYLLDRVLGKAVQPLAVETTTDMSPEQTAAVLARHNLQHLLPRAREVVDEMQP